MDAEGSSPLQRGLQGPALQVLKIARDEGAS